MSLRKGDTVGVWMNGTWIENGVVVTLDLDHGDYIGLVISGERGIWEYPVEQIGAPVYAD